MDPWVATGTASTAPETENKWGFLESKPVNPTTCRNLTLFPVLRCRTPCCLVWSTSLNMSKGVLLYDKIQRITMSVPLTEVANEKRNISWHEVLWPAGRWHRLKQANVDSWVVTPQMKRFNSKGGLLIKSLHYGVVYEALVVPGMPWSSCTVWSVASSKLPSPPDLVETLKNSGERRGDTPMLAVWSICVL